MIYVFYFFAAVLIYFSYKSFRGGLDYLNFFKQELAKPPSNFTPYASIIAPCKGLDAGLFDNLIALTLQDYPEYEIVFVVDSADDEAVTVINDVIRKSERPAKLVIAEKTAVSSQKVENLREAVRHIADESKALVFVDSDARPGAGWLRALVGPLEDETIGATTGYRWFISRKRSFASEMLSCWNASIASALGPNTNNNFCWGGSTAIMRDTFERLDIRERWVGTLSDDFTVTRVMKEAGLKIFFVPQALTASFEDTTFFGLLEFTTRQMKITRVYSPNLWVASFLGSGLFNLVWILGMVLGIVALRNSGPVWHIWLPMFVITVFSIGKSWLRLNAVKLVLTEHKGELRRQFLPQNLFWAFAPVLFFINSFAALISRKITWRSITYELKSPSETVIVKR